MRHRSLRPLTAVAALALTSLAAAAACGSAPVRPLAAPTPRTATPSTATPSTTPPATPTTATPPPTRPGTTRPSPATPHAPKPPPAPPACLGAVTYKIDASRRGPPRSLCITVGGVLWIENLGPDGLSVSPADKVSCYYEAAVHSCRLVKTGTVRFAITSAQVTRVITVRVAKASTPPKPSPACTGATTYTFDAAESGPSWSALCVKVGAVIRLENLGPDGLSVNPSGAVSCHYEAGVHQCRLVKAGTVTFTISGAQDRELTVVVIK